MSYFKTEFDIKNATDTKKLVVRFRNQDDLNTFMKKTGIILYKNNTTITYSSNDLDKLFEL